MEGRIGFEKRCWALILDVFLGTMGIAILGAFVGGVLGGLFGGATGGAAGAEAGDPGSAVAMGFSGALIGGLVGAYAGMVIMVTVGYVLYGLIEPFFAASPGKMIQGIEICNSDGTKASLSTHLLRYAIKNSVFLCGALALLTAIEDFNLLGELLGFVVFIGCFFALGRAKQALHDKIAKTAVYPSQRFQ